MRELGRRSEAAGHPFRAMPPDEVGTTARLAQCRAVPAVSYPGEGPRVDKLARRGSNDPGATVGRFFQTGRSTRATVARVCADTGSPGPLAVVRSDAPPLVTSHKVGSQVLISAACPAARSLGIVPGLALTQARAQVPGLDIRDADPAGDRADLARLADLLARRWMPVVAIDGEDGLLLELTGVAHLHGGEARLARRLVRLLARNGVTARIAIADTAGAAWALARFGGVAVSPHRELSRTRLRSDDGGTGQAGGGGPRPGGNGQGSIGWADQAPGAAAAQPDAVTIAAPFAHPDAIAALPVAALRLDTRALELLARLGVDTVAQLLALPRAPLVRRFGAAIATRLDQATGRLPEPLVPFAPPHAIAVTQRFAEPIATAEAIEHWLTQLVPRLAVALAETGMGARAVELIADRVDGVPQRLRLGFARATRDAAHMLRLALRRIEEVAPGYGIDALTLHVRRADPLGSEPFAPELAEPSSPDLAPLVDTLANRIGMTRLWRCRSVDSDVPERSVRSAPPLDEQRVVVARLRPDDVRRLDGRTTDHPWHPRWPRPIRLLRRPEMLDHVVFELPDRPPARFTWRGTMHRVICADGPERIGGEWWRRPSERLAIRDYFHVEDETGQRFWVFRRGDGARLDTGDLSWFLHGRFG